jgi:hypothetical protein
MEGRLSRTKRRMSSQSIVSLPCCLSSNPGLFAWQKIRKQELIMCVSLVWCAVMMCSDIEHVLGRGEHGEIPGSVLLPFGLRKLQGCATIVRPSSHPRPLSTVVAHAPPHRSTGCLTSPSWTCSPRVRSMLTLPRSSRVPMSTSSKLYTLPSLSKHHPNSHD